MKSDVQTNSDTVILNIARTLSKKLNETQDYYTDFVIPVKVWDQKSQYFGINELICEHIKFLVEWRKNVTAEPLYLYGIGLGRIIECSKGETSEDLIFENQVVEHILELPEKNPEYTKNKTPAILSLLPYKPISNEELIKNVRKLIMDPLSNIIFENSYLGNKVKECSEYNMFFYESYDQLVHTLNKVIKADAQFHFGVECEHFLFPCQHGLIFSFIDFMKEKAPKYEHQWALCLWTSKNESERIKILDRLNTELKTQLQKYHQKNVASDDHKAEDIQLSKWKAHFKIFQDACDNKVDKEEIDLLLRCNEYIIRNIKKGNIRNAEVLIDKFDTLSSDKSPVTKIREHKEEINKCMVG